MTIIEAKKILLAAELDPTVREAINVLSPGLNFQNLPGEEWRDVADYNGKYQVSNYARVRSLQRGKTKFIKPDIVHTGYLRVTLYKDGKTKSLYVHVLVARAFIPNPDDKPCVNHIDGNKQNNSIENLEWCTQSENAHHAYRTGLRKSGCRHGRAKFTAEQVREIRRDCIPNDRQLGFTAFAKKFNTSDAVVRLAYYGETYKNVE